MAAKNKKNKINIVYSTNPDFNYEFDGEDVVSDTLEPQKQNLKVMIDSKKRGGKTVTLVTGFVGKEQDLEILSKIIKNKCGVGGSVKDGEIIIQGQLKDKVFDILASLNYRVKKV